jgi:anti-sigma factor RsiW
MKAHHSELISALVDGELTGLRRWFIRRHVSRCAPCAAEYRHILHVRKMLAENPVSPTMSDSPEFFWSKVKREIQAEPKQAPAPARSYRLGVYATAAAVAVIIVGILPSLKVQRHTVDRTPIIEPPVATVEHASTLIPNTVATTIETKDAEPAVIWVTGLPWTPDMNELKTQFAQLDS